MAIVTDPPGVVALWCQSIDAKRAYMSPAERERSNARAVEFFNGVARAAQAFSEAQIEELTAAADRGERPDVVAIPLEDFELDVETPVNLN